VSQGVRMAGPRRKAAENADEMLLHLQQSWNLISYSSKGFTLNGKFIITKPLLVLSHFFANLTSN